MNFSTLVSLIFSFAMLLFAFVFEGGKPTALLSTTAAMIVLGGTFGAVGVSFPLKDIKRLGAGIKVAFTRKEKDLSELIIFFKNMSTKARKSGLLSIEEDINSKEIEPYIQKGLQLVVDGVDPQAIQSILEMEADAIDERHHRVIAILEAAGGFSPTMGVLGTVMGLVHVLGNLSDPSSLGPKIAVAFVATLYGVGFANLVYLPLANKLKILNEYEADERELITEAVLLIQTGTNPNTLTEKLKGMLDKQSQSKVDAAEKAGVQ